MLYIIKYKLKNILKTGLLQEFSVFSPYQIKIDRTAFIFYVDNNKVLKYLILDFDFNI